VLSLVGFLWRLDTRRDERIPHLLDLVVDAASAAPGGPARAADAPRSPGSTRTRS
jgi:hypothetical protein